MHEQDIAFVNVCVGGMCVISFGLGIIFGLEHLLRSWNVTFGVGRGLPHCFSDCYVQVPFWIWLLPFLSTGKPEKTHTLILLTANFPFSLTLFVCHLCRAIDKPNRYF